jgi:hypothetical protein
MEPETARWALRIVGVASLYCAGSGLHYSAVALRTVLQKRPFPDEGPSFVQAFYFLLAICVFFYGLLIWCGIRFVLADPSMWLLFIGLVVAEVAFSLATAAMWLIPRYASSVAGATGMATGGLTTQLFILLPLWGPVVAWLAHRTLEP